MTSLFRKYTDESAWVYQAAEDLGSGYYTGKVRQIYFYSIFLLFKRAMNEYQIYRFIEKVSFC